MRIIPGKTKVQIELFKGISLWDMFVGAVALVMLTLIIMSNLPYKWVFAVIHTVISAVLLARIDSEPNYVYLISIIRHFGYKRKFTRKVSDETLFDYFERGDKVVVFDDLFPEEEHEELFPEEESKQSAKARRKAEKAERKADDKLLRRKKLTKEEEDAIWLKRANQSAAKKEAKYRKRAAEGKVKSAADMKELSSFTGISGGFIEFGGQYYGAAIEIPSVEFRFFSEYRRANSIENGLGAVLRMINPDYCANIVKIERPVDYDGYVTNEYAKLDELRKSYEEGMLSEEELKARIAIVYDRINKLLSLRSTNKVVIPFYYLVLFDGDRRQLNNTVNNALDTLRHGEMDARRLNDKELAVFLRYNNELDFDEHDIDKVRPEDYAAWAMPQNVDFRPRVALVDGIATHNFRLITYPTVVNDAWLASLMTYPSTKVMVKMKTMDNSKAINAIDRSLSELRATVASARTDSEAMEASTHLETLQALLSMLQGDNETLLDVNIYVSAYDAVLTRDNPKYPTPEDGSFRVNITNMKKAVKRAWSEAGFRLNNMEFNQAVAYIGSQVSGYDPMSNKGRGIPSNTIAACFPWVFPHIMDKNGVDLGTSDGVPVFVDFFERNSERVNSNMVIVGKSGSGKSYATKALLANLAADDAKIFILDPEDEYTTLARNLNGKCINVGNAQYGRLNPFHIITTLDDEDSDGGATSSYATHLQFLEEFFKQILPDCDKDSLEYLNTLVDRIYVNRGINSETDLSLLKPEDYPVFDDLYDEILREFQRTDNEYIRTMLRTLMNYVSKFATGGRNSVIWNGPSSITTDENFTVFNFQSLLSNRNSSIANAQMLLVLKYIDNEIIKNRAYNDKYKLNRKIVVVIDEAHVFIDTKFPVALDFMYQLAKRIRKYNGMQIVITQNIKDFVGSEEIARKSTAIINACQYSFIFSLSPNDMTDLCTLYEKAGGINESEQEQIVQASRGQAFTVMSPTSRSSFRIEVPEGTRSISHDRDFQNPYFSGENGYANWNDFIGDSREKRAENLKNRPAKDPEIEFAGALFGSSTVKFDEITEDEYNESIEAQAKADAADAEITESGFSFDEIPEIPETPEEFAERRRAVMAAEEAAPSRTEEILAELVGKLGTDSMITEIKKAVREEVEKEVAGKLADAGISSDVLRTAQTAAAPAVSIFGGGSAEAPDEFEAPADDESEEDEDSVSLGSIFDFTGLDDEEMDTPDEEDEDSYYDEEDEDDGFDIMAFLAQQSEMEVYADDTAIDDFVNGTETQISVTLEQLVSYNSRRSRK